MKGSTIPHEMLGKYKSASVLVRPAVPGFGKVRIAPIPGYLTSASGEVKTPKGIVKVSWEKKEEGLCLDYSLPKGVEAETGPSANDSHYLLTTTE